LAADDVDANFLHHFNCKRVDLRSRSGSSTDCTIAFWSIFLVEEPFSHLASFSILYTNKQYYLFFLLLLLAVWKTELHFGTTF
jgi:hypothetical protein